MSADDHRADLRIGTVDAPGLCAYVETDADGTTTCTIYPCDASVGEWRTAWVSADEGSFVSVEDAR